MPFDKDRYLADWSDLTNALGNETVAPFLYREHEYRAFSVGPAMGEDGRPAFFVSSARPCKEVTYKHVRLRNFKKKDGGVFILLTLEDEDLLERFADLCSAIDREAELSEERIGAVFLKDQLERWASLLDRAHRTLSEEEIRGLWGELLVLEHLIGRIGPEKAVDAWKAPKEKEDCGEGNAVPQDFSFDDVTIEVKTRHEQADSVVISSTEQLDPLPGQKLFLHVVTLLNADDGMNLSDRVERVNQTLTARGADQSVKDRFTVFLDLWGFDDRTAEETKEYRFVSTDETVYDATSREFPAIRRSDLPPAVVKCRYRLQLSALSEFRAEIPE